MYVCEGWPQLKDLSGLLLSQQIRLLKVYYTVEIALTAPSQFMTFTEPILILANFGP